MNNSKMYLLGIAISFVTASLMGAASSLADDEPISRVPTLQVLAFDRLLDTVIAEELRAPKRPAFKAAIIKILDFIHQPPQDKSCFTKKQEQRFRERAAENLALRENIQEEDIWEIIEKVGVPYHSKGLMYERLAEAVAKDYFLRLPAEQGFFRPNHYLLPDRLPVWLQSNFKGVAIQDLLDYGLTAIHQFRPDSVELTLGCAQINDVSGLEHIPNKQFVRYIYLGSNKINAIPENAFADFENLRSLDLFANYITTIAPGAFRGLVKLHTINLAFNPIGLNLEERARIEAEINAVTGRRVDIQW